MAQQVKALGANSEDLSLFEDLNPYAVKRELTPLGCGTYVPFLSTETNKQTHNQLSGQNHKAKAGPVAQ